MDVLYRLAEIRVPLADSVFLALTYLGSEFAAIAVIFILYWCFNKRKAYYVFANVMFGTLLNQGIKFFCCVPRPFVRDPEFKIVEAARDGAGGYSFPSGHTNNAVSIFGSLAVLYRKKTARVLCVLAVILVGFSRMYLGVHYPSDVLGGLVCGLILLAALHPVYKMSEEKPQVWPVLFGIGAGVSLILALVLEFVPWGENIDQDNLAEAIKSVNLSFGCLLAMAICEPLERTKIRFETKAVWWAQVLKVVLGIAIAMAVRAGLKPVIGAVFGTLGIGDAVRYFTITMAAMAVWPLTFRWFSRLGNGTAK